MRQQFFSDALADEKTLQEPRRQRTEHRFAQADVFRFDLRDVFLFELLLDARVLRVVPTVVFRLFRQRLGILVQFREHRRDSRAGLQADSRPRAAFQFRQDREKSFLRGQIVVLTVPQQRNRLAARADGRQQFPRIHRQQQQQRVRRRFLKCLQKRVLGFFAKAFRLHDDADFQQPGRRRKIDVVFKLPHRLHRDLPRFRLRPQKEAFRIAVPLEKVAWMAMAAGLSCRRISRAGRCLCPCQGEFFQKDWIVSKKQIRLACAAVPFGLLQTAAKQRKRLLEIRQWHDRPPTRDPPR